MGAEYHHAFVYTEYTGYLRRDSDIGGFIFWLEIMNRFPVRDATIQCAMVYAFITSREYQERFSPVFTHSNTEAIVKERRTLNASSAHCQTPTPYLRLDSIDRNRIKRGKYFVSVAFFGSTEFR